MKALMSMIAFSTLFLTACNDAETGVEVLTPPPQQQEVELPKAPDTEQTPEPIQPPKVEQPLLPPVDQTPVLPPETKQPDEGTTQQPNQTPETIQPPKVEQPSLPPVDQTPVLPPETKQPNEGTTQQPNQTPDKQPEDPVTAPEPIPLPTPPEAFTLTPPSSTGGKTFLFQWQTSQNANDYTLCFKNIAASNECESLSNNLSNTSKQVTLDKLLSTDATFFVIASNKDGNKKSNEVSIEPNVLLSSIGFLKASNSESLDNFGHAVAVSNDGLTIAVSALKENGDANDPTANSSALSGAVYVYHQSSGNWNEVAYLKASNADAGDEFGYALALSGDGKTLAVGAIQEASSSQGINGDQLNNSAPVSGAVYVYVNDSSAWKQKAYIKSSNSDFIDSFGFSIALNSDGTRLLVGAPGEGSATQRINGDQTDNTGTLSGAAYLFEFQNDQWRQTDYLKASNTDKQDSFGYDVALSGDGKVAVIGAPGEDSGSNQVDGDQVNNSSDNSGAVYVFSNDGSAWTQESYLKASNNDSNDQFGYSIATNKDGTVIAVGAYKEASDAETNGNEADNSAPISGAAYLFYKQQAQWTQNDYIKASNSDAADKFGFDVQLSNDGHLLAVSAPHESASSIGFSGDLQLNDATSAGAVYLYISTSGVWSQNEYIKASNTEAGDLFGNAIALSGSGNTIIIGAEKEASVNKASPDDNSSPESGAVYIY
ncbi:hypothetical protein ACPV47_18595 [Vibrio jasicida]|uniref:hypothetical protein n=1 Tax=Vibrio jasicida TaxID=766224 RepID=UPI004068F8BA